MACHVYKHHLLLLDNQAPFKFQGFTVKHLATTLRTAALALSMVALPAFAQNVIKIGEINLSLIHI